MTGYKKGWGPKEGIPLGVGFGVGERERKNFSKFRLAELLLAPFNSPVVSGFYGIASFVHCRLISSAPYKQHAYLGIQILIAT